MARLTAAPTPTPVEYAGWLPVFKNFGNCGTHPQFGHIDLPPAGYYFVRSEPQRRGLSLAMTQVPRAVRAIASGCHLVVRAWRGGASLKHAFEFVKTRGFRSQLLLPSDRKLLFLPSVPYTLCQHDWVIEVEDTTSMLFPFVHNGRTAFEPIQDSPWIPVLRAMLESPRCRGIITHVKSTADSIPRLLRSPALARKIVHIPLGIPCPPKIVRRKRKRDMLTLLFTNSWHQNPASFFVRGGLDVLEAFGVLKRRYPRLRLVLRTFTHRCGHLPSAGRTNPCCFSIAGDGARPLCHCVRWLGFR